MNSKAYQEWVDLFDEDVSKTWTGERKELQKSVMLLEALQKELKRVHSNLNDELIDLRCKLAQKDRLKGEIYAANNSIETLLGNKENHNIVKIEEKSSCQHSIDEYKSPDLFRNVDPDVTPIIDLSHSDEEDVLNTSPTLNKGRTNSKRHRLINSNNPNSNTQLKECDDYNNVKKDLFRPLRSVNDDTVIDCTPDTTKKRLKTDIKASRSKFTRKINKKRKNATLTQIFSNCQTSAGNANADGNDSDETYCETSEMGITDMLDYINTDEGDQNQTGNDSAIAEDEFSKGAFLNDSDVLSPNKKPRILQPEPIVRGLARKQLTGFACEKCKNFYGQMNLSPEELQKKMDECSKHRYKYNPPDETMAGLWDLTFSASQVKEVKE